MKAIVTLAVVLGIIGAVISVGVMRQSMADQGTWIYVVMGNPRDKTIDVLVSVELGMTIVESPRLDERSEPKWDEWVSDHFILRGPDGTIVQGRRVGHTPLVDERKVKHLPEFYIQYELKQGQAYTLDHVPALAKERRYRFSFTAPSEPKPPERILFEPVKENS